MNKNLLFLTLHFPEGSGGYTFRKKLMKVLTSIDELDDIICLHSDKNFRAESSNSKVDLLKVSDYSQKTGILKFLGFVYTQIKFVYHLIKLRTDYSQVMIMSGNNFTLSLIFAKLLRKKVIFVLSGVSGINTLFLYKKAKNTKINPLNLIYMGFSALLDELSLSLSNLIMLESPNLINTMNLANYEKKIYKKGYMYQDTSKFYIKKDFNERKNVIGYIGRFGHEKGIMNFINSLPLIEKNEIDIKILIIGWGPLNNEIKDKLEELGLDNVQFLGKITNDQVPDYLNELKLLVFPSNGYEEGLPNIILESMACGTPVLAAPVGGIPDVIKNNETGFILEKNSPECIAESLITVLKFYKLEEVSINSYELIKSKYNFSSAINNYSKLLKDWS